MSSQTVEKSFFYRREHLYDPNLLSLRTGELLERTAMCGLEESTDAEQDFSISPSASGDLVSVRVISAHAKRKKSRKEERKNIIFEEYSKILWISSSHMLDLGVCDRPPIALRHLNPAY